MSFGFVTTHPDGTETPINLSGKDVSAHFVMKGQDEPFFELYYSDGTNANGSVISMTDESSGEFDVFTSSEDSIEFVKGQGTWYVMVHEGENHERLWADFMLIANLDDVVQ